VSVIVPGWNEREGIAGTVRSLVAQHHEVEVVVVRRRLDRRHRRGRGVVEASRRTVVRVPKGGKSAALNTGIALSTHPILVMVDADTVVEPEAVDRLVQPFADPTVGAVAGNVKVGNRQQPGRRWQHIEYVIGFNLDRGCTSGSTASRPCRCARRVPAPGVNAAGGVTEDTLAEDTDLTIACTGPAGGWSTWTTPGRGPRRPRRGQLWRQRYRWSYGTMQALWKHRGGLRDPAGRAGSGAAGCRCWRCSQWCCRCSRRWWTSSRCTGSSS
jgi:cellulose synthase/poly-beta-1,6-N-acetylglucosamine synthase-like glycosyltransferase